MKRLAVFLLAIATAAFPQAIRGPATPTNTPDQTKVTTAYLYYNKMHWAGTWSSTATYNAQDVVLASSVAYVSLIVGNLNNAPATSPLSWVPLPAGASSSGAVIAFFTGCSGSMYLGADGACHAASGSGTVTQVALTMPPIFSIGGSPVTTSGTIAVTMGGSALQPIMANGDAGAPFASTTTALGTIVDGDCADTPTFTLSGATQGDPVWPGVSLNLAAGVHATAKVTASNTVLVEVCNLSESPVTLSSATYEVGLLH